MHMASHLIPTMDMSHSALKIYKKVQQLFGEKYLIASKVKMNGMNDMKFFHLYLLSWQS